MPAFRLLRSWSFESCKEPDSAVAWLNSSDQDDKLNVAIDSLIQTAEAAAASPVALEVEEEPVGTAVEEQVGTAVKEELIDPCHGLTGGVTIQFNPLSTVAYEPVTPDHFDGTLSPPMPSAADALASAVTKAKSPSVSPPEPKEMPVKVSGGAVDTVDTADTATDSLPFRPRVSPLGKSLLLHKSAANKIDTHRRRSVSPGRSGMMDPTHYRLRSDSQPPKASAPDEDQVPAPWLPTVAVADFRVSTGTESHRHTVHTSSGDHITEAVRQQVAALSDGRDIGYVRKTKPKPPPTPPPAHIVQSVPNKAAPVPMASPRTLNTALAAPRAKTPPSQCQRSVSEPWVAQNPPPKGPPDVRVPTVPAGWSVYPAPRRGRSSSRSPRSHKASTDAARATVDTHSGASAVIGDARSDAAPPRKAAPRQTIQPIPVLLNGTRAYPMNHPALKRPDADRWGLTGDAAYYGGPFSRTSWPCRVRYHPQDICQWSAHGRPSDMWMPGLHRDDRDSDRFVNLPMYRHRDRRDTYGHYVLDGYAMMIQDIWNWTEVRPREFLHWLHRDPNLSDEATAVQL